MAGAALNRIILAGKVSDTPEVVFGNESQTSRAKFTLEVERRRFSEDAPISSDLIPVVFFGKDADMVAEQVKQGSIILIDGSVQTRTSTSPSGNTLYLTEVSGRSISILPTTQSAVAQETTESSVPVEEETIDDVPF